MKILLTGASGYIGNAVGHQLHADGHDVLAVCRSPQSAQRASKAGFNVVTGDLTHLPRLAELAFAADGVIHTAFGHDGTWLQAVEDELSAISALGDGLRGSGRSLIVASGGGVLGDTRHVGPVGPDYPGDPNSALAPRQRVDALCRDLLRQGVRTLSLRLPLLVFGEGGGVLVPPLIAAARSSGFSSFVDKGDNRLSKLHVGDASQAFAKALTHEQETGVLHLCDGQSIRGRDLARAIAIRAGVSTARSVSFEDAKLKLGPVIATLLSMWNELDASAAQSALDWKARPTNRLALAL